MKATTQIIDLESKLTEHKKVPPTNSFTEIGWTQTQSELLRKYEIELKKAGYESVEERKLELKEIAKWAELFRKHPVEPFPLVTK